MKIIKIIRSSIKKNPNYGMEGQRTFMLGARDVEIEWKGKIPKFLLNRVFVSRQDDQVATLLPKGDPDPIIKKYIGDPRAKISVESQMIETTCKDYGPEFFYKYRNPFIKCTVCGKSSRLKDIKRDDDEGYEYDFCPHCEETDSFEPYKFEAFQDRNMN